MERSTRLLASTSAILALAAPASAVVVSFDEAPPANDEGTTLGEQYAHLGVHFRTSDDGAVWSGMSQGDPGGWGLEGSHGPAFAGFDGRSYSATLVFDAPVEGFALDVARAEGSRFGDRFEVLGFLAGRLVERVGVRLGGVNEWIPVELDQDVDRVLWFGTGYDAHPFGVDNLRWVGEEPEPAVVAVEIDVKPGSVENEVNLRSRGVVAVALFGSESFDVESVVSASVTFGPAGADVAHESGPHLEDVNGDVWLDLVSHHRVSETGLSTGEGTVCLVGATLDGGAFAGCDRVVGR